MSNPGFLNVSELSFDGIKNNLKLFLQSRPEFLDYDFEGSNLSALLDIMSYNTYMNAYYLNMVGSESFLDSAQIKSSIVSHAKELNYIPRSRSSSKAIVSFTINTGADNPPVVILPKFFTVKASVNNTSMDFSTDASVTIYRGADGLYTSNPVPVYEGKIVDEFFRYPYDTKFILQSSNIDTSSILVNVTNSLTDYSNTNFTYTESIIGLNSTSTVYFLQGYNNDQYEIVFGDGVFGKALSPGNIIKVTYRSTNGELGNKVYAFSSPNKIDNYSVSVSTNVPAASGTERESADSIKFYAPRHYTTQNRAVTKDDYINLIREKYPQIIAINVYGGEETIPPVYGKAIISMVVGGSNPIVPDDLKADIVSYLQTKSFTTLPVIVDPVFIYAEIVVNVYYNPSLTTKSVQQLKTDVQKQINQYQVDYLADFGADVRKSKLSSYIDSADASIVSDDLNLRAIYKIKPRRTVQEIYDFSFENALNRPIQYAYNKKETPVIVSSTFYYDNNGVLVTNAQLADDGNGTLITYYTLSDGTKVILDSAAGTVNYDTGELKFNLTAYDYPGNIDIFAKFLNADIIVKSNKYLEIDFTKLQINVLPYVY